MKEYFTFNGYEWRLTYQLINHQYEFKIEKRQEYSKGRFSKVISGIGGVRTQLEVLTALYRNDSTVIQY